MAKRLLYYLLFAVIETTIIAGSVVAVVCVYLPFVALKGVWQTATGKATPRLRSDSPTPATSE